MSGLTKKKILAESDDEEAKRDSKRIKREGTLFDDDDDDDDHDKSEQSKKREINHGSNILTHKKNINTINNNNSSSSTNRKNENIGSSRRKGNDSTSNKESKQTGVKMAKTSNIGENNSDYNDEPGEGNLKLKTVRKYSSTKSSKNMSSSQDAKNKMEQSNTTLSPIKNTYDIRHFFKAGKGNNNSNNTMSNKDQSNGNKIPVKDVEDYFDKVENEQKKRKGLGGNSPSNLKPNSRNDNGDISPSKKKLKTEGGKGGEKSPKALNNAAGDETAPSFDYLLFNNQKIVITGVFSKYSRDELIYKIKELGGSVMSAVSSKTNYLIHGEVLEDGRLYTEGNKYKKAKDLLDQKKSNIKILNEEEFLQLLPAKNDESNTPVNAQNNYGDMTDAENNMSPNMKGDSYTNASTMYNDQVGAIPTPDKEANKDTTNQLWVEKYRPRHISELVGNNTNVVKLQNWLASWEDVCIKGFKKEAKKTFRGVFENVNAPCALLSGTAGIGKTTTAKIVAEQSGYNVIEFNASDERNKAAVEKINEMTSGGYTLSSMNNKKLKKTCIIMDEVDGMSSGDKGGSQAILKLIEKTKCPVICICNDRQNPKIRTLANKCYDLKFHTPQKQAIIKRVMQIALKEGLVLEPNALELLCDSTNSDIRQILNALQLLSKTYKRINFADIKKELSNSNKTLLTLANPFEVSLKLLNFNEASKLKIREIMDLFFVDHELIPFFISENYVNIFNDNNKADLDKKWDTYAKIAFDLSLAELVKYDLKTNMDFSLLPHFCVLCCVCPVLRIKLLKCFMSGRINFPTALGRISSFNKNKRLLQELCFCLSFKLNISPKLLITSGILNYLYFKIVTPLSKNNPQETLDLMEEYNITKEMITEHFPCLRLSKQENLYDKLDSKTKSAFTRLYNSSHVIKTDPNILKNSFKSDKKATAFKLTDRESDEEDAGDSTDAASKDDDDDPLIKNTLSRKQTMRGGGKATPRAKAGGKKKK